MKRLKRYDAFPIKPAEVYYDSSFNCRGEFTLQSVEDLANSIKERGLDFPIVVQPAEDISGGLPAGFRFRLIAGHRRFRAVTFWLKWDELPAQVRTGLTERQARLLNLTENLERKDLNPLEEALAIQNLYGTGITLKDAAAELKRSTKWIERRLRVMDTPEHVQRMVASRRLTLLDLEVILQRGTVEAQIEAAEALAGAKRIPGHCPAKRLGPSLTHRSKTRRTRPEINALIGQMLEVGISGLATRVAAWCAGAITDEQIQADISKELCIKKLPPTVLE